VFDHGLAALVHGSGYELIAPPGCSDRTIRRRLLEWAEACFGQEQLRIGLDVYDRMIGLDLEDLGRRRDDLEVPVRGRAVRAQPG
jgi:hypothetical protein